MTEKLLGKKLLSMGIKTRRKDRRNFILVVPRWDKLSDGTLKNTYFKIREAM